MTTGTRFVTPYIEYTSFEGRPYAGGKLYFYEGGTSTPQNTYSDVNLGSLNDNPIILDDRGSPGDVFLISDANYKVILFDSDDNEIWRRSVVSYEPLPPAPPPPPPVTPSCLLNIPWVPSAVDAVDISAISANLQSQEFGVFYNGTWFTNYGGDGASIFPTLLQIPGSNYTIGGTTSPTYNIGASNSHGYLLGIFGDGAGFAYGLDNAGPQPNIVKINLGTSAGVYRTAVTVGFTDVLFGSRNVVHNGKFYALGNSDILRVDTATPATQTLLALPTTHTQRDLVGDPTNNQVYVISKSFSGGDDIYAIDLANFTLGGITTISMLGFPDYGNAGKILHGYCDGTSLFLAYIGAGGETFFAAMNVNTNAVTGHIDIKPCGNYTIVDIYPIGSFIYLLCIDLAAVNTFVLRVADDFSVVAEYQVNPDVTIPNTVGSWVFDGVDTLYVKPGGNATADGTSTFRITP